MASVAEEVPALIRRCGFMSVLWEVMEHATRVNTRRDQRLTKLADGIRKVVFEYDDDLRCRGDDDDARVDGVPTPGD